jgi:hypothetical protein
MTTIKFETRRVEGELLPTEDEGSGYFLGRIRVRCPETGKMCTGLECTSCTRFVGWYLSTAAAHPVLVCRTDVQEGG